MEYRCIHIAARSKDFNELDRLARELSKKTGIPYDNKDRVYDKKQGMILPDDPKRFQEDAGQSFPRRYDENRISIEMMHYYGGNDETEMVLVVGIYETSELQDAEKVQKDIYDFVPLHEILIVQLYMGCTH